MFNNVQKKVSNKNYNFLLFFASSLILIRYNSSVDVNNVNVQYT